MPIPEDMTILCHLCHKPIGEDEAVAVHSDQDWIERPSEDPYYEVDYRPVGPVRLTIEHRTCHRAAEPHGHALESLFTD